MSVEPVCKCRKHAIDPRCPKHGIGKSYLLNLATGVLVFTMAALAIFTAPADAHSRPVPLVICDVFGRYCDQALRVSYCESRWSTRARNGQYLGIFQMGSWERRTYGHGPDAYSQARAAWRYFKVTGKDWSPWACRWAAL